jgi:sulfur-oxidizing protein SoxY
MAPGAAAAFAGRTEAAPDPFAEAVRAFTGGVEPQAGRVALAVEPLVENGNAVPIAVSVESPMTPADHVEAVLLLAERNPTPVIATLRFSPDAGEAFASLRVRLAESQTVTAVARMSDGSVFLDRRAVEVAIGGCGSG